MFFFGVVVGLAAIIGANAGVTQQKSMPSSEPTDHLLDQATDLSKVRVTPDVERRRALFVSGRDQVGAIHEAIKLSPSGHVGLRRCLPLQPWPDDSVTTADFVEDLRARADAVVIGRVVRKTSYLTADEAFLFTDYQVELAEVLKASSALGPVARTILVSRPGGKVVLDGHVVEAVSDENQPLVRGRSYVLFLRHVPEADTFVTVEGKGALELSDDRLVPASKAPVPASVILDRGNVLNLLRSVTAN